MPYGPPLTNARSEPAKFNRFLSALPPGELSSLMPYLRTVQLVRGAVLHEPGDAIEYVYFVHSGMVSLVAVMRNGATVENVTLGREGIVGATAGLGSRTATGRAVVQVAGSAARISGPHFRAVVAENPAMRQLLVDYNDLLIGQIQQSVACHAMHSVDARLCRWLLHSHDCLGGEGIPLTQEFLGQMLGVRRTTVTIAARLLQSTGIIRYRRGLVHVLDRIALEAAACECYASMRSRIEETFPESHPLANPAHEADRLQGFRLHRPNTRSPSPTRDLA